jgi:uncharacterized spore protein YtfJ
MVDVMQGIDSVARTIQERLSAKTAYGEPVSANGVTVIPVARVSFGFGGGGGAGTGNAPANGATEPAEHAAHGSGSGGGGGGGALVRPIGFIEINDIGARWVAIEPARTETLMSAIMVLALLLPGRGGRGFLAKLVLMLAGQAVVRRLARPELPMMPGDFSMHRQTADATT